jgi:hypothetical protein
MTHRGFVLVGALVVSAVALSPTLLAQKSRWTPPRTVDGQPDLQGTWANDNVTPLERPLEFGGRPLLTDEELATLKARSARLFNGDGDAAFGDQLFQTLLTNPDKFTSTDGRTGDYNQFWLPDRVFDKRTSLIVDPPDGRIPALTAEVSPSVADPFGVRRPIPEGPEDRGLSERCITFGVPRVQAAYMSYYQIVQSRDSVAIVMETIHDTRIVSLDGRPHLSGRVRHWLGDSRGHWEGDTLVVDTTNFSPKSNFRGSHDKLHLVERFTRVAPDRLEYTFTVEDPTTWVRPWTVMIPLQRSRAPLFEYACHEGNLGLAGILSGARADEKAAAAE